MLSVYELDDLSKFLSYVLRHRPDAVGVKLDAQGWARIAELLPALCRHHPEFTIEVLQEIVRADNKQRYSFSDDGSSIRANQGHSRRLAVAVDLAVVEPPALLFHGTKNKFIDAIRSSGLKKMTRQHVHLSPTPDVALNVGERRMGETVILTVLAELMHGLGHVFMRSANGVWLIERVPPEFLVFPA